MSFLDVCAGLTLSLFHESQFATPCLTHLVNPERSRNEAISLSGHAFSGGDLLGWHIRRNLVALELAVKCCAADPE